MVEGRSGSVVSYLRQATHNLAAAVDFATGKNASRCAPGLNDGFAHVKTSLAKARTGDSSTISFASRRILPRPSKIMCRDTRSCPPLKQTISGRFLERPYACRYPGRAAGKESNHMSTATAEIRTAAAGRSVWPRYPSLYEISTWVWLSDLSRKYGKTSDLASVPAAEWDAIGEYGFDAVWLMGVWERRRTGVSSTPPGLRRIQEVPGGSPLEGLHPLLRVFPRRKWRRAGSQPSEFERSRSSLRVRYRGSKARQVCRVLHLPPRVYGG
jgi:hypothetical protein